MNYQRIYRKVKNRIKLKRQFYKVFKNPHLKENYILPVSFITKIDLEPIAACNLKCAFCQVPGWKRAKLTNAIKTDTFESIIDQLPGLVDVKLQGMGEPFINPRLIELIQICNKKNLYSHIATNGTLLTEKKSKEVLDANLTNLTFSIDGATKETYENAREGANFNEVLDNIKYITNLRNSDKKFKTQFRIDCLASNDKIFSEIPQLVNLASKTGVDRLHIKGRLKIWQKNKIKFKNQEHFDVKENIYLDSMKNYNEIIAKSKKIAKDKKLKLTFGSIEEDAKYSSTNHCMWPWDSLFIGTDGKVVPCCIVGVPETWTMGDLTHQKINDIWNNDLYISLRKQLITGEIPNTCKPCYN